MRIFGGLEEAGFLLEVHLVDRLLEEGPTKWEVFG